MAVRDVYRPFSDGYWLRYSKTAPSKETAAHVFCGRHAIDGATCPTCKRPLLRFASLDTRDERLGVRLRRIETIHLLMCWVCQGADTA
jgi:hypothetical protein